MDNGSQRLERIERALERLAELQQIDRDFFVAEQKALLKWQISMQGQVDQLTGSVRLLALRGETRDERIDKLVVAIGELIKARNA